jgi:hypothetical protein
MRCSTGAQPGHAALTAARPYPPNRPGSNGATTIEVWPVVTSSAMRRPKIGPCVKPPGQHAAMKT